MGTSGLSIKIRVGSVWQTPKKISVRAGNVWNRAQNQWTRISGIWKWTWTGNRWFTADRADNTIYEVDPIKNTQVSFNNEQDMESLACVGETLFMYDFRIESLIFQRSKIFKYNMVTGVKTLIADPPGSESDGHDVIAGTATKLYYIYNVASGTDLDLYEINQTTGSKTLVRSNFIASSDALFTSNDEDFFTGTADNLWILSETNKVRKFSTTGIYQALYTVTTGYNLRAIAGSKDILYGLTTDGRVYKLLSLVGTTWTVDIEPIFTMNSRFNYLAIQKT